MEFVRRHSRKSQAPSSIPISVPLSSLPASTGSWTSACDRRKQIAELVVARQREEPGAENSTTCEAVGRCCRHDNAPVVSSRLFPQHRTANEFHPRKSQLLIRHQLRGQSKSRHLVRQWCCRSRVSPQNEKSPIQARHCRRPEIERTQWDSRSTL